MVLDPLYQLIGTDGATPNVAQMCWRAALTLALGLAIVRLAGKRLFGRWGAFDIVISVVIGSSIGRAMTGNAPFVATFVGVTLLVVLHSLLAWAAAIWPGLSPVIKGRPSCLIRDGNVNEKALLVAGLGRRDLLEALRLKGVAGPEQVDQAWLERDGAISVIRRC
ncbi:hypothetical protein SCH01S_11_00360 [Sphingomonas changbaiensis NBRC 104936]|uniref:YetF C-terminal domain-containing protein n=1 Tax=Sphingomonas changbaiensis NBRC 104936 TaxID=1219043 RepID=A0A0E9MLA4_9SPHN|nr:YetF domain-containing protein [Sphingomonas changbaiensis]GAO38298.1 hypothetical protein SCH01S_11_00360 [Sphingomonas changbaiensis NBRC 104936]